MTRPTRGALRRPARPENDRPHQPRLRQEPRRQRGHARRAEEGRLRLVAARPRTRTSSSSTPAASSAPPARRPRRRCAGSSVSSGDDPAKKDRRRRLLCRAGPAPASGARFPGVDAWTGVRSFDRDRRGRRGPAALRARTGRSSIRTHRPASSPTPGSWAYVKVSEGCSHRCGFCAIPLIKGPYVSRSAASIVREVRALAGQGVREIDLISHDTTWFGRDRGVDGRPGRPPRAPRPRRAAWIWIRFLYGYPEEIDGPLLEAMAGPKFCRYFDIPFQHAGPRPAQGHEARAGRRTGPCASLDRIRTKLPGAAIRTSLIVGFPGEGPEEFAALRRFVQAARFDHLGVFAYSPERGTSAFGLAETVAAGREGGTGAARSWTSRPRSPWPSEPEPDSGGRSTSSSKARTRGPAGRWTGRGRFQAPEVDGVVRFGLPPGLAEPPSSIVRVEIVSADAYDLAGRLVP
ncbi:MAG: radical SAM protein [Desulfobacterales bacterium]|nr:radical SAM protein [Desulfobacterales bacterium]